MYSLALIIPAAGSSARYQSSGGLRSKLDEMLGDRPVLQRTCEIFSKFDDDEWTIGPIVVAGPHEESAWQEFREKHADRLALLGAVLCKGGKTHRYETVQAALKHVPANCTHIAVHDAARPCLSHALLTRVLRAARKNPAVIPALRVSDTIKLTAESDAPKEHDPLAAIFGESSGPQKQLHVVKTVPRDNLVLVQTPQVFEASLLREAYAQSNLTSTDDAGLVEPLLAKQGKHVVVVDGEASNIKLTYPEDLALAKNILGLKDDGGRASHKKF
jgi:2-C-methyl-D-erythritol 4-phosphate cytidylyltransferase